VVGDQLKLRSDEFVAGILRGDRRSIARAISAVENETEAGRAIMQGIHPHLGRAHVLGITGSPGAGKSTLVSRCSAARPKIADYPFTTVEPVLGVVKHGYRTFVMMEVPGLLEGAHLGVGLGHQFLRHAERARLYLHLLDGLSQDPVADFRMVNHELAQWRASWRRSRRSSQSTSWT